MEGTSAGEQRRKAKKRKMKMEEETVPKKVNKGAGEEEMTERAKKKMVLMTQRMDTRDDEKRPKHHGQPRSVRKFMGFTNTEIRSFVKAYTKFGVPLERLDCIAQDAELTNKSVADLKALAELLHNTCISTMEEYEQHLKNKTTEGQGSGKQQGPFIRISGVSVNAKAILQYEEELAVLHAAIPADPEERKKFHLPRRVKTAHFDVDWGVEDDASLLLGVYKYGYRNWDLIKLDQELNLGAKILPVETDKMPQGKQLEARVDYLLRILRKSELKKREPGAGKDNKTPKRQEECRKGLSSQENVKKPSEEAMVKPKVKQVEGAVEVAPGSKPIHTGELDGETFNICKEHMRPIKNALKQLGELDKRLSKQEKVEFNKSCLLKIGDHILDCLQVYSNKKLIKLWKRNLWIFVSLFSIFDARKLRKLYKKAAKKRSKQKDPKGQVEAKARSKERLVQGAIQITKEREPVLTGEDVDDELDEETFSICKEQMRPVKKALKWLEKPDKGLTTREHLDNTRSCLLKIGDQISKCLQAYSNKDLIKLWRTNLWIFASKFTECDAWKLHKLYKMAVKKRSEQVEQEKEDATGGKKEASGSGHSSIISEIQHSPHPAKLYPPPSHLSMIHEVPRHNYSHETKRHFNNPDCCKWRRDCQFNYGGNAKEMWGGERSHPYGQQHWHREHRYGNRRMHQEPHHSSGHYRMHNLSCKRPYEPYNSDRGRRDDHERHHHDAKRCRSDQFRALNYHQQDCGRMAEHRPPMVYRTFYPDKSADYKQPFLIPRSQNPAPLLCRRWR